MVPDLKKSYSYCYRKYNKIKNQQYNRQTKLQKINNTFYAY